MSVRKKLTPAERRTVYDKLGGHCAYCGCEIAYKDMQVDHVFPIRGGMERDKLDNMLPACRDCNHYKRGNTLEGMSILTGWFSLEWVLANISVGLICGRFYDRSNTRRATLWNVGLTVLAVAIGMLVIKTAVSCWMWSIPVLVKLLKSIAAWVTDSIVMCDAIPLARRIHTVKGLWAETEP